MSMRAVLWDMDGTLVDSAAQHWESWRVTLEAEGLVVTHAQFAETFGQRNDAILGRWLGTRVTPEAIRRLGDAKEALYRELVVRDGLAPLPGAADWVRRLAGLGWRQAVASSAPRLNVEVVVRQIGLADCFAVTVAGDDVALGKPAPDIFLEAARRVGAAPRRCVVVEDSPAGIEAARRAGMPCIGVADGLSGASLTVHSLAHLPDDAFDRLVG